MSSSSHSKKVSAAHRGCSATQFIFVAVEGLLCLPTQCQALGGGNNTLAPGKGGRSYANDPSPPLFMEDREEPCETFSRLVQLSQSPRLAESPLGTL